MIYTKPTLSYASEARFLVQINHKPSTPCHDSGSVTTNYSAAAYEVDE